MIAAFNKLTDAEIEAMLRAPLVACILIAGADGTIDRKEMQQAIALSKKKDAGVKGALLEFYNLVSEDFEDKLKIVLQGLPADVKQRNHDIVQELTNLNNILPKLDKTFATEFYMSLRYITTKIAGSSGGVLGIRAVGEEEERFVDLPMIKAPT